MPILIDVRTPEEFNTQHAQGAINLPLQDIEQGHMPKCSKTEKVMVYCRTWGRSEIAKEIKGFHGFSNVANAGGLNDVLTWMHE